MLGFPIRTPVNATSICCGLLVAAPFTAAIAEIAIAQTQANANFPDTQNHWAQPFIQRLAARNIIVGYLDGTYRPNQPVKRDEFAAIIRQAFNQERERQIPSGSVYNDIPGGYWAASAIEEAYETGFMHGYPGGYFRPNQPVSKVEAIVSLAQNLNLQSTTPTATQTTTTQPTTQTTTPTTAQPTNVRQPRRQLLYPLAMTTLLQPLVAITTPQRATAAPQPTSQEAARTAASNSASLSPKPVASDKLLQEKPASDVISNYYQDANQIPQYAVDRVAEATQAGIVVNYPNRRILNPNQPATRGEVAAIVHQVLVNKGRLEPLGGNIPATNYIIGQQGNQ
ncbi:MAG: S-layer homology domain-containing protein [Nostocaceae cyanobacterium]|nr:S-layer homology domain-containing protein [Nostocaceae cyanobacterium]